jgi:hypothetical protein
MQGAITMSMRVEGNQHHHQHGGQCEGAGQNEFAKLMDKMKHEMKEMKHEMQEMQEMQEAMNNQNDGDGDKNGNLQKILQGLGLGGLEKLAGG